MKKKSFRRALLLLVAALSPLAIQAQTVTLPLVADFEDGSLGVWTTIDADGDGKDWYALDIEDIPGHNNSVGLATSASYESGALTPDNYLVSPLVPLGGTISFWACAQDEQWATEHFGVAVSTTVNDDAKAFTTIWESDMAAVRGTRRAQGNWYQFVVDLNEYEDQVGYVAIRHFDCTDYFRLNVDDIVISTAAAYPAPYTLMASNITKNSATISWTPGKDEAAWSIAIWKATDETNVEYYSSTTTSKELLGLVPGTTYKVKVCSDYGDNNYSEWTQPISFTTLPVKTLPYVYGFEDGFDGWTMVDCVSISGLMEDAAHTGNYGFVFNYTSNPPQYLISPELEGTENGISVSFWYKNCSADYPETFCVGYSTTTSDIDAFTWSDELTAEDTQWTEYTSTILTKDVKFVAIKHTSDDQLKLCLDDFIFEVPTDCSKPTGLTVDYTGGTTAQVSWTSDATAWNIDVNGTIISVTENPYTLTNLELSTTYEVKVKADCGNGSTSSWTYPVSFTTDGCLDPLVLNYTLTDSYGDGWNGNAIQVIDENDEVIAILTLSSGASASGSLHICAQYVKFVWVKGNYADETSWTFSNELGETLFSGIGTSLATGDVLYEIDNSEFPKPSELMVGNVTATTANVSWNLDGRALRAELQYAKGYADSEWCYYDSGAHYGSFGLDEPFSWGVMFPAGSFMGDALKKVKVYDVAEMEGTLSIYNDGTNAPSNLIASKSVSFTGVDGFVEFDFNNLAIEDTKNVWVVFSFEGGADYVAAASQDVLDDPNGRWVEVNGNWSDITNYDINGLAFMIRAEIGGIDDPSTMSWTTITDATSPYTLTELDPKTYYSVRVKAVYADGESEWVNDAFKTYPENEPPFNLAVTDIDYTAATFNWTGNQNSYNVQYRKAPIYEPVWVDDFEAGLGNWTIRAEGDVISGKEGWYDYIAEMVSTAAPAMSGSYVASSWSWVGEALHADNWLITPQLELGGTLIYYEQTSPQYPDSYEVLLSLTDNKNASFTETLRPLAQAAATGDWNEVRIDLSEYAGQKGYIAIHHVDTDKNYLFIDDFGLYNVVPAGEWIAATTSEPTLAVADLTSGTDYEWQVQGITEKGTTEWTESTFTTKAHAYEVTFAAGTPLVDTWKISANPAPEGQIVSLTFGAQKKVGSVEANGKAAAVGGSNRWIFLMPSEDVEVTVAYESALALNEEDDNTDILAEWNGCEANVTLTRTLLQGYNTLAVPFDVNEDTFRDINDMLALFDMSMTMKELASSKIEDGVLTLNFQDVTSMKAGKPYLVKVTSQGLTEFPLNYADFPDAIISKDAAPVSTDDVIFVPTLGKTLVTGPEGNESNANRVLFLGANNTLLTPTVVNNPEEQGSYMKGFRGYFQLKDTAAGIRAFNLNIEGEEATGIQEIENGQLAVKGTFDLQGRRVAVQPLHKGVYIVNGKKVVKK